jgi:hypothetical protein
VKIGSQIRPALRPAPGAAPKSASAVGVDQCQRSDVRLALIDKLLRPMPERVAQEVQAALLCFNEVALQDLLAHGVKFGMGQASQQMGGDYNPWSRGIQISEPVHSRDWKHLRTYVLHEAAHALDHRQGRAQMNPLQRLVTPAWDELASKADPHLGQLYAGHIRRSSVDLGYQLGQQKDLPKEVQLPCRNYKIRLEGRSPQRLMLEEVEPLESLLASAGPSLTPATIGMGLGVALAPVMPFVGLPLMLVSLPHVISCWKGVREEFQLGSFQEGPVKSERSRWQVELGEQAPQPSLVSPYATLSRKKHEYFAEAMADFLHSPKMRQRLQERDPAMYEHCLARGWHQGATA